MQISLSREPGTLAARFKRLKSVLGIAACWLNANTGSLKEQVVRGGTWLTFAQGVSRLAGIAKFAVLGRLLAPTDFGLLGIAVLVETWFESFTQTGLNSALIQKRENIRPYLNTAWTVQLIRGILITGVIFVGAPFAARFFGSPEATSIIRTVAFSPLVAACCNPAVVYLRKHLDFRKDVLWRFSGVIAGLVAGVVLALLLRNVWALVLSLLCAKIADTVASYWIVPYRPRFDISRDRLRELMVFGKWISWSIALLFLEREMDSLAVGRLLGAPALGYYQVSHQLATVPAAQIGWQVDAVLFPAFSKIEGLSALRGMFLSSLRLSALIVVPGSCFIAVFAEPLVRIVLGVRWISIVPVVQILVWTGIARALTGIVNPIFLGLGHPKWPALALLLKIVILAGSFYPLLKSFGIAGVAMALTAASAISLLLQFFLVRKMLCLDYRDLLGATKPALLGAGLFLVAGFLAPAQLSIWLLLAVVASGTAYLAVLVTVLRSVFSLRVEQAEG